MIKKKALLVAEKPSAMKAIKEAYEKMPPEYEYDIDFTSAAGHLVAFFEPDEYKPEWGKPWRKEVLPMVPETWVTKVINSKYYNQIKDMWEKGNYEVVINAGDAGREGQLIQMLIYSSIGINVPILRFWADEFTEKTVKKALNNLKPNEEYKGLTDASYLRAQFDWLIGMNESRAATQSLNRFVSIGRVMTPTLAMIVQRDMDIKNFKPVPYYEVEGMMKYGEDTFPAFLLNPAPEKNLPSPYAFSDRKKAEDLVNDIGDKGSVTDVSKEEKITKAPTLFNLSDLQKEMATKNKYSPAVTLETAQSLYEKKFISYPRTESKCLTRAQAGEMRELLATLRGGLEDYKDIIDRVLANDELIDAALKSKKYVDDKKVQDHPALTPTTAVPDLKDLSERERAVYIAILLRLLAIFLPPAVNIQTVITISANNCEFRATGTVVKDKGWRVLYNYNPEDTILPSVKNGDSLDIVNIQILNKETKPPKYYTNATILDAMETAGKILTDEELEQVLKDCKGLGTAATRAEILEKLVAKYYISIEKNGTINATDQGIELINALKGQDITSPELTAKWEQKLKQVEDNNLSYDKFYSVMVMYVSQKTKELLTLPEIGPYNKVIGRCPKCKERDFISVGSYYCCAGFLEKDEEGNRKCDFALPTKFGGIKYPDGNKKKETQLSETDIKNLITGSPTKIKTFYWSKDKSSQTALVLTPDFRIGFPTPEVIGRCPVCGGDVLRGQKGGYYCVHSISRNGESASCDFRVYGAVGRTNVSEEMMRQILSKGQTEKKITVTWKSGKKNPFASEIILVNDDTYGWMFTIKPEEKDIVCGCPYCNGGHIIRRTYSYECDRLGNGCNVRIERKYFENEITPSDLKKLLNKQELNKELSMKKDGKKIKYKASLVLEKVEKGEKVYYNIVRKKD